MRIRSITSHNTNKISLISEYKTTREKGTTIQENFYTPISQENYLANAKINFKGSGLSTPIDVFKREVYSEENYEKAKKYVSDHDGNYNEELGARFVMALNIIRTMAMSGIMSDYNFLRKHEQGGLPGLGEYKVQNQKDADEINENIKKSITGEIDLQEYVLSIQDKDIRARVAEAMANYLEKYVKDCYTNQTLEDTINTYKVSHNSKKDEYNLSDYRYKAKLAYSLRKEFGDSFDEIIKTSYMSNGDISTDFLSLYLITGHYDEDFFNVRSFEKHCLDSDWNIKNDEFAFFAKTQYWLSEESSDEIFFHLTDRRTGEFNKVKGEEYAEELRNIHNQIREENRRRDIAGIERLDPDFDKIAVNLIRKIA